MNRHFLILTVVLALLFVSACGPKATEAPPQPAPAATEAPTAEPAPATAEPLPPADTPAPAATEEPTAEPTEAPVVITHVDFPGDEAAIDWTQEIRDCNTGERVALGATTIVGSGCDDWSISKIERPVMAFNDTFIPGLDINRAYMGQGLKWYYASIHLHDTAAGNLPVDLVVALELDTNIDSRGEYLITTSLIGPEWSTDGVQVWQDVNGDVGGEEPMRVDGVPGDGYETLLFDNGLGDDPDLAWARVNPADGAVIEIAFKDNLMPASGVYAWWVWTAQGTVDPAGMEVLDSLSPDDTWRIDNTCGWIFGAKPSTRLRNLCTIITPTPVPTATPTNVPAQAQPQPTACPYFADLLEGAAYCKSLGYWSSYWDNDLCKCRDWQ